MIRLLLAEDQAMVRGALATLLGLEPDITVVGQVEDGPGAVSAARRLRPDLCLLDIEMPGGSGLDAAETLHAELPETKILIFTVFDRPGHLQRALAAGAGGFIGKNRPVDELAVAIRQVMAGETVMDPALAAAALRAGPNPLTRREQEVLATAIDGASVPAIAARVHLSEKTVRNYLSSAIQKTDTANRFEAAHTARERGWL
ncbi:response regulator transcription factor [Streptomyces lydicus]|uniref:response regulator transcription factor n=1 Tax=Streptomyces lydicus TaxID=47763 RepID=UPI00101152F1|nr:response regulator transcription factor [Streptomyces lydicus]MCZ1005743.1 response regulator transcription factor [Streptomyces lydicus]